MSCRGFAGVSSHVAVVQAICDNRAAPAEDNRKMATSNIHDLGIVGRRQHLWSDYVPGHLLRLPPAFHIGRGSCRKDSPVLRWCINR